MNHATAEQIIRKEWQNVHGRPPTNNEVYFTQAVAWLETNYGRAGQHAALAANGQYNWANIEKIRGEDEVCPPGWAEGQDQHPVCFKVFSSDNEAARALIGNLTKRHWPFIDTVMKNPTAEAVADAMAVSPSYYGNNPPPGSAPRKTYAQAISNSIRAMGKTIEAAQGVASGVTKSKSFLPGILIGIGALGIGASFLRKGRR